jgi:hypothetical protein
MTTARAGAAPWKDVKHMKLSDSRCAVRDMPGTVFDLLPGTPERTARHQDVRPDPQLKKLILHEGLDSSIRICAMCLRQITLLAFDVKKPARLAVARALFRRDLNKLRFC